MKKRILFVFERLQTNGASMSLLNLLETLSADEYDISLFLFSHEGELTGRIPRTVKLLPELPIYRAHATQMKVAVREALRSGRIGVAWYRLCVWLERGLKRPFSLWGALPEIPGDWDLACSYADGFVAQTVVRKVRAKRKALWVHEDYERAPRGPETLSALRAAGVVVGVSKDAVRHVRNLLGDQGMSYHVVHNVVDVQKVRLLAKAGKAERPECSVHLVSVGRVSREKRYDRIPRILAELTRLGVDAQWTVVGPGLDAVRDAVMNEAEARGLSDRVHFVGGKANPHPYVATADVFVQLSQNEGWCMTISEALCLGKWVVANDLPVFHEQIVEGENGSLVKGDDGDFASAIQQAMTRLPDAKTHKIEASRFVFSAENVRREFAELA